MKAPLAIWSQYYNTKVPEDAILEFEKDGLHYIELSYEHGLVLMERGEDRAAIGREFKEFMSAHGISAPQAHLTFPTHFVTNPETLDDIVEEIKLYVAIGVKCAVLHCDFMAGVEIDYDKRRELNILKLRELAERISDIDITICLENLCQHAMSADELLEIIEKVGSPKFAICLDSGHLSVSGASSQRDFILKAGKHLKALHLHDNDGSGDQHVLPYARGKIDFSEIVTALREIDYEGLFNFEILGESSAPMEVRHAKAKYVSAIYDYLMK